MKEKKSSGHLCQQEIWFWFKHVVLFCITFIVPRFVSCKVSNGKGLSDSKANCITWLISVRTNTAFKLQRNVNDTKTKSEWSYWVHIKDILQNEKKSSLCSNLGVKTISHQKDPNTLDAQQKLQLYSKYTESVCHLFQKTSFVKTIFSVYFLMINVPSHISEHRFPSIPEHAFPFDWWKTISFRNLSSENVKHIHQNLFIP